MDGINPFFSFLSGDISLGLDYPGSLGDDRAATEAGLRRILAQALAARMGLPGAEFPPGLADQVDALLAETFDDGPPIDVRRPDQLVCPTCMQVHLPVEGSQRIAILAEKKDTEENQRGSGGENGGTAHGGGNERDVPTVGDSGLAESLDDESGRSMPSLESIPRANAGGTAGEGEGSLDDEEASIDPSMPSLEVIGVGGAAEVGGGGGDAGSADASNGESLDSLPPLLGTRGDDGGSGGANVATSNDSDAGGPVESGSMLFNDEETGEGGLDDEESIINSVVRRLDAIDALVVDVGSSEGASVPSLQDAGASSSDESSMPSLEEIDDGGNATSSPGAPVEVPEVSRDDSSESLDSFPGSDDGMELAPQPVTDGSANSNNSDESHPESTNPLTHLRDYGALRVIAKANCPICLEFHEPVVALPCGHCLCEEDYGRLGGYLASDKEKLRALVRKSEESPIASASLRTNEEISSSDAIQPHWDVGARGCAWAWTPCKDANCRMGTRQHCSLYSISAGGVQFRSCYPPDCTIAPDMIGGLWIHLLPRDHAPAARFQVFRRHWRGQEQRSWESDGGVLPCTIDLASDGNDGVWALCETADAECFLSLKHHNLRETRDITTVPYETRLYSAGPLHDKVWAYVGEQRRFPFVGSLLERGLWLLGANTRQLVCRSPVTDLIIGSDGSGNMWVMGERSDVVGAISLKRYSPNGWCEDTLIAFSSSAIYSVHACNAPDIVFLFRRFAPGNDTGELVCVIQHPQTKLWSCNTIWECPATTRFVSDGSSGLYALCKEEHGENVGLWRCDWKGHLERIYLFDEHSCTGDMELIEGHDCTTFI